ncbi:MAG: response regulator [Bacteroidales bacterium]|nr:response regulator [Bacteroidales bacterium]
MGNQKEIRILFAEDNESDFELAVHELKSAGLEFISECVEKRADFEKQLTLFQPDIIISDYYLSDFNGLDVLAIVSVINPHIPIIITTGSINEETAVNCMKSGASDYVLKDQFRRLPISVKEILHKKQLLKAKLASEAAIRKSEERFSSLLNHISDIAVQGYQKDGTIKYWNKASERLYQYRAEEALGKNLFDLIVPTDLNDYVRTRFNQMIETEQPFPGEEFRLRRKDGQYINVISNHAVYRLTENEYELYSIDIDLSARINAENALQASEKKYRNLVENSLIGIYQSTFDGRFLFVNEAFARLLEYNSPEELMAIPVEAIYLYPDDRTELVQSISESQSTCDFETILLTKSGYKKDVIINASSEENYIAGMVLDITARKAAEREMIRAREIAEESDRLKSSFLANLSHEVRTPMNGIVGFSELLFDDSFDEESKRSFVETISQNSYQLLSIISDIIEISKIETEQLIVNYREFSLSGMMNDLEKKYRNPALNKSLSLNFYISCREDDLIIISDEEKIRQALLHLLDNAIKFTEKGGIIVRCDKKGTSLEFCVEDTGIGVKSGSEELIFKPFRQVEESLNRKYGGNGLGLPIAKAYIESLGGTLWLKPNPEGGSIFCFNLPARFKATEMKNNPEELTENPDYSMFTFLIAEDEITNMTYLKKLLIPSGASFLSATTGKQAIEIIERNPRIHLVFMDIKMPEIDGLEATRIIKKMKPHIPVIATTAYAMTGDREMCISAGCDEYIAKPIRKAELFRIIRKVMD